MVRALSCCLDYHLVRPHLRRFLITSGLLGKGDCHCWFWVAGLNDLLSVHHLVSTVRLRACLHKLPLLDGPVDCVVSIMVLLVLPRLVDAIVVILIIIALVVLAMKSWSTQASYSTNGSASGGLSVVV